MTGRKFTEFHKLVREKGWTLVEIGERWGVSKRQMSRVAGSSSQRDIDAATGLPYKTKTLEKEV
ncbi:hypothetical protein [Marinobacter sp. ELB17]|uniref:hypothetical protein n=1 Tax=Marinobacter sp. ELB17 TaxID=270374 RepID=UPI0000F38350|nr:hypothetical protein [Marinobacter sp. ELB17]EAZ98136.1 hypothetical protein MELB17_09638 [Marinobacter sp. ELB17]